jgi:hypothetical protein
MRRKGIQGRNIFRKSCVPCDLASFVDQIQRRRGQRRNVNGLANMAGAVGSARVMVDKNAASSEIQESNAAQNR